MRNHHVIHTFGRDFGNDRSGHTSTFCRDYFSSHRKAGAQGIRISRMSTVLIVSIQIGKGWFALRIRAYVCNNPSRRWRIVGTELHWCAQRRNPQSTENGNCKAGVITVYSVLKRVWHRSCGSNQDIQRGLRRDVKPCFRIKLPFLRFEHFASCLNTEN